jgi:hypothetical protein
MKSKLILLFCCAALVFVFASCSSKDSNPIASQSMQQAGVNNVPAPGSSAASGVQAAAGQGGDHHSEQIIFSGEGTCGSIGDFGFWIWSQDEDANSPVYAGEAAGAIRIEGLLRENGVEGDVTEPVDGTYVIDVSSRDGSDTVVAELTFSGEPEHGPNNTVTVHFTSPEDCTVDVTNAVVNVTGPEED